MLFAHKVKDALCLLQVRALENKLRAEFKTLLIRPQPTGPKLRYNHEPLQSRSRAYPKLPKAASTPWGSIAASDQDPPSHDSHVAVATSDVEAGKSVAA